MGVPASVCTITLKDENGFETTRSFEGRIADLLDADAVGLADDLQALTQLEVVDVTVTKHVSGFTPIAVEANSSVAETASVTVIKTEGDKHTFNLPALKAAQKSGKGIVVNAALLAFLANFDNGDGVGAAAGPFFISDGEEISEAYLESANPDIQGKVNR